MSYCIYKHTCKINGKSYIGYTVNVDHPEIRWGINGKNYALHRKDFYDDIQKYGWDNFEHIILETGIETELLAKDREKYWISFYKTYENGYNHDKGSGIWLGLNKKGKKIICIETKEIFISINDAVRKYNLNKKYLKKCLKQTYRTYKKKHYVFLSDYENANFKLMEKPKRKHKLS